MNISNLQKVLKIVSKYVDADKAWCEAQHDIIFLPLHNNIDVSMEDQEELRLLGAHEDSEGDCWAVFT